MKISGINTFYTAKTCYNPKFTASFQNTDTHKPDNNDNKKASGQVFLSNKGIQIYLQKNITNNIQIKKPTITELHNLLQEQLMPATEFDVVNMIKEITSAGNITEEEAVTSLQILTQFANMQSLVSLGENFRDLKIREFNDEVLVSTNSAFNYLYNSKKISSLDEENEAFILDKAGLEFLEQNPKKAQELINREDVIFVNLEGWNNGINIFNQGKDLKEFAKNTADLIEKAKNIQQTQKLPFDYSLRKVINADTEERAKKLGIKSVETISKKENHPSVKSIVNNLAPYNISIKETEATINAIVETVYPHNLIKAHQAKKLITGYLINSLQAYSPKRLGDTLKKLYSMILEYAKSYKKSNGLEFNDNNIVYIVPEKGKSFSYINLQYALVNNIDFNKFQGNSIKKDNRIYVVLDDLVGSGDTMLWKSFKYAKNDYNNLLFSHILMTPIISTIDGMNKIMLATLDKSRLGKDLAFVPKENQINALIHSAFYRSLSNDDKEILTEVLASIPSVNADPYKGLGYEANGACIVFPYMAPDNNATLTSLFIRNLLPNTHSIKSLYKESSPTVKPILKKIEKSN